MADMHFYESGQPGQPAVVFLHGGGLSGKSWQPQMAAMEDFQCLAPDLPGQGQSQGIRPFTLEDSARRVAALITDRVPSGRAHVVGLSLGGAVALTVARLAPQRLERMMISGSAAGLGRTIGRISLFLLGMYKQADPVKLANSAIRQFGIQEQYRDLVFDDLVASAGVEINREFLLAIMEMKLPETLSTPLLVTVGQFETAEARKAARKLAAMYPQVRTVAVPGMRHAWNLQDPALFTRVLKDWLLEGQLPEGMKRV